MTLLDAFLAVLSLLVSPVMVAFVGFALAVAGFMASGAGIAYSIEERLFDWASVILISAGVLAMLVGVTLVVWGVGQ